MTAPIARCIFLLMLTLTLAAAGCGWSYRQPPTADGRFAGDQVYERPVIVVGRLANPVRARVQWKDIGAGMSAALAAALRSESRYEAWVDAPLADQVAKALQQVGERRERSLVRLRQEHGEVRFVVVGAVTDFAHSGDLPPTLQRRGLFGRKDEAVVAMRLELVDLALGRVVASDHIYGTASAKSASADGFYADMAFGSYLFWSTPLGRASEAAIDRTIKEIDGAVVLTRPLPRADAGPRRVARQTGPRTLELERAVDAWAEDGRLYFVCEVDEAGEHHPVFDPETGYPLKARIQRPSLGVTTRAALLLGRKPPTIDLVGAMLCPVSPDRAQANGE